MLRWTLVPLTVAVTAGLMGFTGIVGKPLHIDRVLFFFAVIVFVLGVTYALISRRRAKRGKAVLGRLSPSAGPKAGDQS